MIDQATKARNFIALHKAGDPIILYNAWDAGSAKAIAAAGAKAIATGDHPVGFAHGFTNDDFDGFTFDTYLVTIKEIAQRVDELPFSVDISNGDDLHDTELKQRIAQLLDIGIVGVNFEDRLSDDSGLATPEAHAARIATIRAAADDYGVPLCINARSDLFAQAEAASHAGLINEALSRAEAYKQAGANSFFVPGLMDIELISQLCERSPLPVNIIRLPGAPETRALADAGVSRVSYGPVVQMQMTAWLTEQAKAALNYK